MRRVCATIVAAKKQWVLHNLSVFVGLGTQQAMRMRHIVTCGLPALQHFPTITHKRHDFGEKKKLLKTKCLFWFSLQLMSETVLILRRNGRSQWPRGLRRKSTAVRLLVLWVRIPPEAWTFVCCLCVCVCVCCQGEVSVTSWPLVQESPTDCGASLCVTSKRYEWGATMKQAEPLGDACSK